jgi:hypothetical protein
MRTPKETKAKKVSNILFVAGILYIVLYFFVYSPAIAQDVGFDSMDHCQYIHINNWTYTTHSCSLDIFYLWEPVPDMMVPAVCDSHSQCIPTDWETDWNICQHLEEPNCIVRTPYTQFFEEAVIGC